LARANLQLTRLSALERDCDRQSLPLSIDNPVVIKTVREWRPTTAEIAKATDWQNHSIRGFINGNVTKKMGLAIESSKNEAGERTYRIAK